MIYDRDDLLNRAKKFAESSNYEALRYACLDLRMCIELICYEKFELYLNEIPIDTLKSWQPRKVLKFLLEIDPYVCLDQRLVLGQEDESGCWREGALVVDHKAISLEFVTDTYDKLGSFMHVPTTSNQRAGHVEFIKAELRNYLLNEVIPEIERLCTSDGVANFAERYSFKCVYCGMVWNPTKRSLERFGITICPVDTCRAVYNFHLIDGKTHLRVRKRAYKCPTCGEINSIEEHKLKEGFNIDCKKCSSKFRIRKTGWTLERRE